MLLDYKKEEFCLMKQPDKNFLTNQKRLAIILAHRQQKVKRIADRLKSILLLDKGFSYVEVSDLLLLDENTIRNTYSIYKEQGIAGLLTYNYQTALSYLSLEEQGELDAHLQVNMYQHSKEIKKYVEEKYGVEYSAIQRKTNISDNQWIKNACKK